MSLINRIRKQTAVLWSRTGIGATGNPVFSAPVAISCRWEDTQAEFVDSKGVSSISRSVVYVDRDLKPGDMLMLTESGPPYPSAPTQNTDVREVREFSKMPDLKNRNVLLTAYLV